MNTSQNQIRVALAALEMSLDPVIWRTKLRIQELMILHNPTLRVNIFATHLNHLFTLLIVGVSTWDIILSNYQNIYEERYEEGEAEPILRVDIPQTRVYGIAVEFNERFYAIGLMQWKSYTQIRNELKWIWMSKEIAIIHEADEKWLMANRIFYRRVNIPKKENQ